MALATKVQQLIDNFSKEEAKVKSELISLKNDGILDKPLEDFLTQSLCELKFRRLAIAAEFRSESAQKPPSPPPYCLKVSAKPSITRPQPLPTSPKVAQHTQFSSSSLFKNPISPQRGNSPSAMRYSPHLTTPSIISKLPRDIHPGHDSPPCSTRSSASSIDRITDLYSRNSENYCNELYKKYQEQREIRNKAHEKMLIIKERMLRDKEAKIEGMYRKILMEGSGMKNTEKPPKPPENVERNNGAEKVRVETLLGMVSGVPKGQIDKLASMIVKRD